MDRNKVENYRLSLFGQMVMGVSHEVDNYLSVILGFAELIQMAGGGEKKTLDGIGKILNAGERINVIIRHFSQYVRPHPPVPERFSPGEALRECLVFSKYDLGRNNVSLQLPDSIPQGMVNADRRDFVLILLALLFNGSEAMAAKGGALRLSVSLKDGNWEFIVADEGPGIPPEIAPRVFEEGFTTKSGPVHSGNGLPLARFLAAEMGGTVSLAGSPSGGCEAVLRIPANGALPR
jgi:signal transduction histidine kinase